MRPIVLFHVTNLQEPRKGRLRLRRRFLDGPRTSTRPNLDLVSSLQLGRKTTISPQMYVYSISTLLWTQMPQQSDFAYERPPNEFQAHYGNPKRLLNTEFRTSQTRKSSNELKAVNDTWPVWITWNLMRVTAPVDLPNDVLPSTKETHARVSSPQSVSLSSSHTEPWTVLNGEEWRCCSLFWNLDSFFASEF